MIDQIRVRGESIISIYPTNINNRFHRKFGNNLKDFDLTPNDITVKHLVQSPLCLVPLLCLVLPLKLSKSWSLVKILV